MNNLDPNRPRTKPLTPISTIFERETHLPSPKSLLHTEYHHGTLRSLSVSLSTARSSYKWTCNALYLTFKGQRHAQPYLQQRSIPSPPPSLSNQCSKFPHLTSNPIQAESKPRYPVHYKTVPCQLSLPKNFPLLLSLSNTT